MNRQKDGEVFGMRLDDFVRIVLNAPTVLEASEAPTVIEAEE